MKTDLAILKLSFFLSLVVVVSCSQAPAPWNPSMGTRPGTSRLGYEIRMYNSAVWMSTDPIPASSMTQGTKTGFNEEPTNPIGYVTDDSAIKEALALMDSSEWKFHIEKSKGAWPEYLVTDYNPPFQTTARVNEILVPFDM
ncbi:unnamed protein product [Eruca vesicaria subsp. sativa]|uniref:Uncharacterized protein n=1 Tax=Eruca vesicaria subsp. sativa TaxID=29727 RepID=A0ABC8JFI5_ERUVS|nr:unnamed protein product [Eruca vesicaria subsp. sativa]